MIKTDEKVIDKNGEESEFFHTHLTESNNFDAKKCINVVTTKNKAHPFSGEPTIMLVRSRDKSQLDWDIIE